MNYEIEGNKIIIKCAEFNPVHIFECGQVFAYKKIGEIYFAYPENNLAVIYKENKNYIIECLNKNINYFINYFDLNRNYCEIIDKINIINKKQNEFNKDLIKNSIKFGNGIRILKQEIVETIISFIFSANNNIKRFTKSLNLLREHYGSEIKPISSGKLEVNKILEKEMFFSFPTLDVLLTLNEKYFVAIGAGYRAPYLVETIKKLPEFLETDFSKRDTQTILAELLKLKGIGRKVAQCILLFSFNRFDVFPVDTWIKKVYDDIKGNKVGKINTVEISKQLIICFGNLSGFIQQYLFFYKREIKELI